MDTDRIQGAAKELGGKVEAGAGNLIGDKKTELEGRFNEAVGKGQNVLGQAQDAVRTAAGTASDVAKDAYNNPSQYVDKAKEAVRGVAGGASDLARDAYNNPGQYVDKAQDVVRGVAGSASDLAQDAYNNPGRYAGQAHEALTQQVEENPLVALLIAGAVGYGLALLIHGRH